MAQTNLAHRINAIQNTAEVIAQSLKEMIHEAELKPGQPLIQERIAEMFEVSRVPVRDALQLLLGMGLAVNIPRRGVIVRPLSLQLLDELFEVRKILEGAAFQLLLRTATHDLQRRLQELIRQQSACLRNGDVKSHAKLDDIFHETLYGGIGNGRLRELILSNWEMIKQARCASVVAPKQGKVWIATSINRHRRILAALRKRDAEAATAIIFANIESSKREITSSLREMGWLDGSAPDRGDRFPANPASGGTGKWRRRRGQVKKPALFHEP